MTFREIKQQLNYLIIDENESKNDLTNVPMDSLVELQCDTTDEVMERCLNLKDSKMRNCSGAFKNLNKVDKSVLLSMTKHEKKNDKKLNLKQSKIRHRKLV